jgi:DNA repair exonuclease SbcCD nuclease subunit
LVTFLHTADWQIGMTRHWLKGEAQARFDDARLEAVRSVGRLAAEHGCDFVVVSGDVFDANQLAPRTVLRALEALREVPVPVYLLPGNHDPLDALSIYRSPQFVRECPEHVHVLSTSGPVEVSPGVEIVAAPWSSKHPEHDLVAAAVERSGPADGTIRVVVGHGAVDTLDPDRENRAVIRLERLEAWLDEGRIHYVALGDRHSRTSVGSTGAIWYSGSPEVTDTRETAPGDVLVVQMTGGAPSVTPHHVGTWEFRTVTREVNGRAEVDALDAELAGLPRKDRTVVRLALRGLLTLRDHAHLEQVLGRHEELLAALVRWERHTHVTLVDDGDAAAGLGLSGFVARAADEMRDLAGASAVPIQGPVSGAEGAAGSDPVEGDDDPDHGEPDDDHASPAGDLAWVYDPSRPEDDRSAREALALLYRLTSEAGR